MIAGAETTQRFLLVRPGATDFDDQGRIKGSLDMPLNATGRRQVSDLAEQVAQFDLKTIFTAPCESAMQTAQKLADHQSESGRDVKVKVIDAFRNLDHGLWHGKLIDELKRNHPKLYRRGIENADEIIPPGGEAITEARTRVLKSLKKVLRKSGSATVAIVMPDPMAGIVKQLLEGESSLCNLWSIETDAADWDLIEA